MSYFGHTFPWLNQLAASVAKFKWTWRKSVFAFTTLAPYLYFRREIQMHLFMKKLNERDNSLRKSFESFK